MDGTENSVRGALAAASALRETDGVAVSCVPCADPDRWAAGEPVLAAAFPPEGNAYNDPKTDTAQYLWRWIGMHAPDLTIEVRSEAGFALDALNHGTPSGIGTIPARVVTVGNLGEVAAAVREAVETARSAGPSPARLEMRRRVGRSPIEVATQLGAVYGHKLEPVMYIPALAIVGRMRLGELTGDPQPLAEAERLADPYRTGAKESMGEKGNGSTISGHLVFSALAAAKGDPRDVALAKKVADYGFDEKGEPKESMPFHSEMSDSVFMGCAILAETGQLTGDSKYFAMCLRHLRFMRGHCLRKDGIYRHSPLDDSAWGRGNGFPALGMALSLSALPEDSPEFAAFLESYRAHLTALRAHQDPNGMWHQIIDRPESYREFTSTCMITFAILRGLRRGWLDEREWAPVVAKSWPAILSRIAPNGDLVDVCTGTGKMKSPRDYFDRTAILGKDDRGGAMALMVSTERAFREKEQKGDTRK
ncbi:MAG: glycoside hydrolase family 88 protein [Akkermansiaceae bacterium]|nr:glycoside hydrolase family 88 protein [Akkermansiaceae bacterium]